MTVMKNKKVVTRRKKNEGKKAIQEWGATPRESLKRGIFGVTPPHVFGRGVTDLSKEKRSGTPLTRPL